MEIKISVIMPSLNVRGYIEEAVRSVMGQTLREIEILCIDAGSGDGTWEILSRLAEEDSRIVLLRSDRKSYGYQVNMGMDMANGKYVAVLETDDYAEPQMYGLLYQAAEEQGCDYVKSDYSAYWTQRDGERFFIPRKTFFTDGLYGRVIRPGGYPDVAAGDWYLWTGIYRKEFLDRNGIRLSETLGAAYQDIGFLFLTTVHAERALYLEDSLYRYCIDREGASSNSGKGLRYSCQEFRRLRERPELWDGVGKSGGGSAEQALYCRMAQSFICCYGEMETGSTAITDGERAECYAWFRRELDKAVGRGIINSRNVRPEVWKKLGLLLESEECYTERIRRHDEALRETLGRPGEYPTVVFGCGYYGYGAYQWLKRQGYRVEFFVDNNRELWRRKVDGIEVKPPEYVREPGRTIKYLIANERHSLEIREQLAGMGVKGEDMCTYV